MKERKTKIVALRQNNTHKHLHTTVSNVRFRLNLEHYNERRNGSECTRERPISKIDHSYKMDILLVVCYSLFLFDSYLPLFSLAYTSFSQLSFIPCTMQSQSLHIHYMRQRSYVTKVSILWSSPMKNWVNKIAMSTVRETKCLCKLELSESFDIMVSMTVLLFNKN